MRWFSEAFVLHIILMLNNICLMIFYTCPAIFDLFMQMKRKTLGNVYEHRLSRVQNTDWENTSGGVGGDRSNGFLADSRRLMQQ